MYLDLKIFVLSLGGGITMGKTDYASQKIDYIGKGSFEYFFPSTGRGNFGLGVFGGVGSVAGKDSRVTSPYPEFNTNIDYVGLEATYLFALSKVVYPYLSLGFSILTTPVVQLQRLF